MVVIIGVDLAVSNTFEMSRAISITLFRNFSIVLSTYVLKLSCHYLFILRSQRNARYIFGKFLK